MIGEDGRTLSEKWDDKGISTLHGLQTRGYPNYFMLSPSQGAFTVNLPAGSAGAIVSVSPKSVIK